MNLAEKGVEGMGACSELENSQYWQGPNMKPRVHAHLQPPERELG